MAIQNILQLYASGHLGGTYMSLGDGTITTLQLIDGYMMPYAGRLEFGGRDLTNYMIRVWMAVRSFVAEGGQLY